MPATVQDLTKAARLAAQNQATARAATQTTAAQIAAQRGAPARTPPSPNQGGKGGQQ